MAAPHFARFFQKLSPAPLINDERSGGNKGAGRVLNRFLCWSFVLFSHFLYSRFRNRSANIISSKMKFIYVSISFLFVLAEIEDEISLKHYEDEKIEEELRLLWLGGPCSPEQAVTIFNRIIDILNDKKSVSSRTIRFTIEAENPIRLLTGDEDSRVENPVETKNQEDPDWLDEEFEAGSGHLVDRNTMVTIMDMHDGDVVAW